jgi:autotransporter-associated beta strand protein
MSHKQIVKIIDQRVVLCVSITLTAILFNLSTASAVNRNWIAPSGDWSTPACWGGTEPTSSDNAYVQNGGTASITLPGEVCLALIMSPPPMSTGSIDMTSGSLATTSVEIIGMTGTCTMTQSGGTNTCAMLFLGYLSGSTGIYNLSGGSFSVTAVEKIGINGVGVFNQSGGINSPNGFDFGTQGIYNLTGGTLLAKNLNDGGNFNFGGGTLQAIASFNMTRPIRLTGTNGNANIDTAGYSLTSSGPVSGPGGLNKLGAGTLTILNSNYYTGSTTIDGGGTLKFSGGIPTGTTSSIDIINGTVILDTATINNPGLDIDIDANGILCIGNIGGSCTVGYISGSGWIILQKNLHCAGYDSGTLQIQRNGFQIYSP